MAHSERSIMARRFKLVTTAAKSERAPTDRSSAQKENYIRTSQRSSQWRRRWKSSPEQARLSPKLQKIPRSHSIVRALSWRKRSRAWSKVWQAHKSCSNRRRHATWLRRVGGAQRAIRISHVNQTDPSLRREASSAIREETQPFKGNRACIVIWRTSCQIINLKTHSKSVKAVIFRMDRKRTGQRLWARRCLRRRWRYPSTVEAITKVCSDRSSWLTRLRIS